MERASLSYLIRIVVDVLATAPTPDLEALFGAVSEQVDALLAADLAPGDVTGALALARAAEAVARKVRAVQLRVVDVVDQTETFRSDGHRSAGVLAGVAGRLSSREWKRRDRECRCLRAMPMVADGLVAGAIGACQVDRIARVWVNPRVQAQFTELDGQVAVLAARLSYEELDRRLTNWVREVDEDGTADRAAACHENRDVRIVDEFDGGWSIDGRFGSLDGAQLHAIHRAFIEAEFAADWAEAREVHGDATTVAHLARTDAQRRADAFKRMALLAADAWAASRGGSVIDLTVTVDLELFERELARMAGGTPEPRSGIDLGPIPDDDRLDRSGRRRGADAAAEAEPRAHGREPGSHGDAGHDADAAPDAHPGQGPEVGRCPEGPVPRSGFRCETIDGHPIDPREAVAHALVGRVRRAVIGADGVVIDLSRRIRLFTGPSRLAVQLSATHCPWPGCTVPTSHCQADHLQPWSDGGSTSPGNGAPMCGRHNRWKEHGFTVRRDARGRLHVHRPDGTEIDGPFP